MLKINRRASNKNLNIYWELIIKRNNEENGNFDFNNYVDAIRSYARFVNEYTTIKACILKLVYFKVDLNAVKILKEHGYIINLFDGKKKFDESISAANSRSNNLVTKLLAKKKEIERFNNSKGAPPVTFAKAIMSLSAELGYAVNKDITLEEYNEAKKLIKRGHGRNNQRRRNKGS